MTSSDASDTVRVYPEEWRDPIPLASFSCAGRDLELEYRLLRVLTENQKMISRLYQEDPKKDRYRDILPFEENRVILPPASDGSTYFNGSYIPNYNGSNPRSFIATQGPLKSTIGDHYDCILEHNVRAVFAIGSIYEGTTEKFAQYWPDEGVLSVESHRRGTITIELLRVDQVSSHVVRRELRIVVNPSTSHLLTHYHFTSWPDHSAMEPEHLLELVGRMQLWRTHHPESPILVHCSAGVGRTGCAMVMCNVIEDIEADESPAVSIMEHTIHLRRYRLYMMQTTSQYLSVYRTTEYLLKHRQGKLLDLSQFAM